MSDVSVQPPATPRKSLRWVIYLLLGVVLLILCLASIIPPPSSDSQWSLTRVAEAAKEGRISRINVDSTNHLTVTLDDGKVVTSSKDPSSSAMDQLTALGVSQDELSAIDWEADPGLTPIFTVLLYLAPLLIVVGVIIFFLRWMAKYASSAAAGKGRTHDGK
jgi:ATP-dependent Zn protease